MANSDLPAKDSESSKIITDLPGSELTGQGKNIRGIYIPAGKVKSWKHPQLLKWIKQTNANAVLIDVKDDLGRVVFTDDLPYAKGSPNGYNKKLGSLITVLKENNIYTIARLVCFKDNLLSWTHPETAILDYKTGKKWKDNSESRWVDPYSQLARDHIESIAVGAKDLGFDEIQLDYVRFPVDKNAATARFPNKTGETKRYEAIAALLKQVDEAINIPLSIDVFGLTAYHPEDSEALGQKLEYLAPYIDAISPMVYLANWPAHYWDSPTPEKTHQVIKGAIERIYNRLGDNIEVRPLLQGFQWRAENWGYSFVVNQIDAANKGGASGYFFWNAAGKYGTVSQVWKNMDREKNKKTEEILTAR
ncbi:MAG: hypothetical protein JXR91_16670 [Deltaproteobacteria bacterium]|nr:hypothetical protein [Deltaproteobacteria bacterium]